MLLPNDAGIVWENMVREMEMAWAYDIYSSADRRVRDTHYVPDLELNQHCQGGQDLNTTHQNKAESYLGRLICYQIGF